MRFSRVRIWVAELTEPLSESNRLVWVSKSSLGIWLAQISDVNGGWRGRKSLCYVYCKLLIASFCPRHPVVIWAVQRALLLSIWASFCGLNGSP
ncbi:hypothetical protein TorRG33x02_341420 [Trema orientale]|uniref:Uncharacterized protein n=1 Tax=Trema orientale TaxID=63057 RepID=A0A2P5ATX2_TREOI|nr:hypothetical protein TorRG33x02_341420 [Trema orientale]